jgi:phosphopantothenoylcysteine synthetase/decarboxylase
MADVLITAGATRNPVDAIRYLSAHATGRTGVDLAERLAPRHRVHLLGSAEACLRAPRVVREEFTSTRDLAERMERWCRAHPAGVVLHSAAVGDYEMTKLGHKIPSGQPSITLTLTACPKIVDAVRDWAPDVFLVSFKAADPSVDAEGLERIAQAQLARTRSDVVFANVLGRIEHDVLLVSRTGTERFATRAAALHALTAAVRAARPG